MLLVLIALTVGSILAATFMASSSTSIAIANNVNRHSQARSIAESGLELAIQYVREDRDWRTDQTSGSWLTGESFGGGTFSVKGVETDGDFTDDDADTLTLTVTGYFDGVSHTVSAELTGIGEDDSDVLLLVVGSSTLSDQDEVRLAWAKEWGWSVNTLADDASDSEYATALADADVVWVSEEVSSNSVGSRLTDVTLGVVNEEPYLLDDLLISNTGSTFSHTMVNVIDNSHFITSHLSSGNVTLSATSTSLGNVGSSLASDAVVLARKPGSTTAALTALEAYDLRNDSTASPGRRVSLPWGGDSFDIEQLNDDAKELMRKALVWTSNSPKVPVPLAYWQLDETSGSTANETINSQNGSYVNSPTLGGAGLFDNSPEFDTDTDRVTLPHSLFDGLTNCTISYWIRTTKSGNQAFLSGADTNSNNNAHLHWAESSTKFELYESTDEIASWTMPDISDGYWHHIVLTRNQTDGKLILYFDGKSLGTKSVTLSAIEVQSVVLAEEQDTVGGGFASSQAFVGSMDDVRLFSRVLSSDEVKNLFDEAGYDPNANVPRLLAMYVFNEPAAIAPLLASHWPLNESVGGAVGWVPVTGDIALQNSAVIDGYDPTQGVYSSSNNSAGVVLSTDKTSNGAVELKDSAKVDGDVRIGPSTYFPNVVKTEGSSEITGEITSMTETISLSGRSAPSGMPSTLGNVTVSSGSYTISSNRTYRDLKLTNSTKITISGNVVIKITDDLTLEDSASIVVPSGSSLQLHVADDMTMKNSASIHNDSTSPERVEVFLYGSHGDLLMENDSVLSGRVFVEDDIELKNNAKLYGVVAAGDDLTVQNTAGIHVASNLPGFAPTLAVDIQGGTHGRYRSGAQPAATGKYVTAAEFDGSNDYIEIPHDGDFLADHGTVSFWVYADSLSGHQGLFSKDANGNGDGGHLHIYADGSALKARNQSSSASYSLSKSSALSTSTWHHVAVTWGGRGFHLFLDGSLVGSDNYNGGLGETSGGAGNTEPIVLGANTWSSSSSSATPLQDYFDGRLDDVRFYTTQLDGTQVTALYNNSTVPSVAPPVVRDTSGAGNPLDLYIQDPANTSWISGGGLTVASSTKIVSPGPASKLYNAITTTGEYTIEAVVAVANLTQDGPARIASLSSSASAVNMTLGQDDDQYVGRTRTSATSTNGTPEIKSDAVLVKDKSVHLMLAFAGDEVRLFRDGVLEKTSARTGDLSTWVSTMRFMLANEDSNDRPWLGKLYRVAVWDRAFNGLQAKNVYNGLDPGTGKAQGGFSVKWVEQP